MNRCENGYSQTCGASTSALNDDIEQGPRAESVAKREQTRDQFTG